MTLNVCIIAYACEPGAGSEPGAGWEIAMAAASFARVTLVTRHNNLPQIHAFLEGQPHSQLEVVGVDGAAWALKLKKGRRFVHPYYLLWQRVARQSVLQMHERRPFDVVHHVTFAADWLPAFAGRVAGSAFVWGPVGGATTYPWRLLPQLSGRAVITEITRNTATTLGRRMFGRKTARRAAVVIANNADTMKAYRARSRTIVLEPHASVPAGMLVAIRRACDSPREARVGIFVGHFAEWKGLDLALRVLAEPSSAAANLRLAVYGAGPPAQQRRIEHLIERLQLADRVTLWGWQPRTAVLKAIQDADFMLFPSMHDSAPFVVAEALTLGTPVVCLDRGGPATLVGETGLGVVVAATPADLVARLADAVGTARGMRHRPQTRWLSSRFPDAVADWYSHALPEPSPAVAS